MHTYIYIYRERERERERESTLRGRRRGRGGESLPTSRGTPASRAVAGKLGRFQRGTFQEFVPESFKWTVYMSRPGTNISIREIVASWNRPSFHATALIKAHSALLNRI